MSDDTMETVALVGVAGLAVYFLFIKPKAAALPVSSTAIRSITPVQPVTTTSLVTAAGGLATTIANLFNPSAQGPNPDTTGLTFTPIPGNVITQPTLTAIDEGTGITNTGFNAPDISTIDASLGDDPSLDA